MVVKRKTRLSAQQVKNLVRKIPGIINGSESDRYGLRPAFTGTVAHHLYSKIFEAYMVKSRGQADELGLKWKPLSQATKIARLSKPHVKKKLGLSNRTRGLLTSSQNKIWKKIYSEVISNLLKQGVDYKAARDVAAGAAWNHVKALGAVTRADVANQVFFPIMINTGRLVASLSPSKSIGSRYRPKKDQIYHTPPGQIVLGTEVEYSDKAGKTRPLWPDNIDQWVFEAVEKGVQAIQTRIAELAT